jgi:YidC/Oxa1 family membrane protein insertase
MKKKIILLLTIGFLLTGCRAYLVDEEGKNIRSETGQMLPANVLCQPTDPELRKLYEQHEERLEVNIDDLPKCNNLRIFDTSNYSGLWVQLFVIPLAWLIINIAGILNNYGLALIIVGLLMRLLLMPLSIKSIRQAANMRKAQPELNDLEKRYKNKKDNESTMRKSQEMMGIYKKHKVSPLGSCLLAFLQLPLFLAFLSAINRTPAIFEGDLWVFQLGTTPLVGIQSGQYFYIILIVLIIATTFVSFKYNMNTMGSPEQQKQMKFMMNFMLIFISVASFSLPSAIGIYWITTNAFIVVQNLIFKKRSAE